MKQCKTDMQRFAVLMGCWVCALASFAQDVDSVLMHVFGFFSGEFSELEREKFFELQESYKKGKITIGTTLADMHPITYRFNKIYLASQTYFLLYSNQEEESIFKILDKK